MKLAHVLFACSILAATPASSLAASGDQFPNRPIRVVIGPGTDTLIRLLAPKLQSAWTHPLVVDQRPGAGGAVAAEIVARAAPDGHTWLISTAVFTINASMLAKPPYNLERDFAPVTNLGTATFVLLVHPSVPAKSVAELINLAREKPGQLNYASSGVGTPPHLAGEMFKSLARVNLLHVPYKSAVASITDLIAGQVQMTFRSKVVPGAAHPQDAPRAHLRSRAGAQCTGAHELGAAAQARVRHRHRAARACGGQVEDHRRDSQAPDVIARILTHASGAECAAAATRSGAAGDTF